MEKLNAEAVKKALECWASGKPCEGGVCDLFDASAFTCDRWTGKNALALITSQEQRIKELTEENERLRVDNGRYEAENHAQFDKWLKLEEATKRHHAELFEEAKIAVKEDTVRKMQEEIQERCIAGGIYPAFVASTIDQIAKEMLEG